MLARTIRVDRVQCHKRPLQVKILHWLRRSISSLTRCLFAFSDSPTWPSAWGSDYQDIQADYVVPGDRTSDRRRGRISWANVRSHQKGPEHSH